MVTRKKPKKIIEITERGVLESEMARLMSPEALKELKELSPTMQQFLLRFENARDLEIEEYLDNKLKKDLKQFIKEIYEADNERVCQNVANIVGKQLSEVLTPWNTRLAGIEKALEGNVLVQNETIKALENLAERTGNLENKVYTEDNKTFIDIYTKINKLTRHLRWYNIAGRIAIGVVIAILLFLWIHSKQLDHSQIFQKYTIERIEK